MGIFLGALALGCNESADADPHGATSTGGTGEVSTSTEASGAGSGSSGTSTTAEASSSGGAPDGWFEVFPEGATLGMFMSVWGPAPDQITVVGGQEDRGGSQGIIVRFDGTAWTEDVFPPQTPWLNWVAGIGQELWAVGREGAVLRNTDGSWIAESTPTDLELWGVWGTHENDVWLVGGNAFVGPPILLHFDGTDFTSVDTPFLPEECLALFKVWGRATDEVYVVGDHGAVAAFDGVQWSARPQDSIAPWLAVWAAPGQSPVVVGGRSSGRVGFIGSEAVDDTTLSTPGLSGVWVDETGTATVVGDLGTIGRLGPGQTEVQPEPSGTTRLLHATFGFDEGPRYAVGGNFHDPPPKRGIILRADP